MTLSRFIALIALVLALLGGVAAFRKFTNNDLSGDPVKSKENFSGAFVEEISLEGENLPSVEKIKPVEVPVEAAPSPSLPVEPKSPASPKPLPEANRMEEVFSIKGPQLPFIETIVYKSRVAWLKGRPAWISDYANHYGTSRHFIARSLNGKPDYFKQDVNEGDRFNVLKKDQPIEFHLVVDASRCKMWLYYVDPVAKRKILLKNYTVSLGRPDKEKSSGMLTPLGKFSLGKKVAIYKPGIMGHYRGRKTEMVTVFGVRWIPFEKEIADASEPAKGFGIHGVPWVKKENGNWGQDVSGIGKYVSDGCIRMETGEVEELFALIITQPAFVEIVKDYADASIHKYAE